MTTPDPLPIDPIAPARWRRIDAVVTPPGSKSLTNRAVLLAALARGTSTLRRPLLDADDAQRMLAAVRALGAIVTTSAGDLSITGVDGRWAVPASGVTLDLGNAGTATRFLAAASLLAANPITIDGDARMRQRPIGELAVALLGLGAGVEWLQTPDCPPLRITPPPTTGPDGRSPTAATVTLGPTQSSQFISALLLIGPWLPHGLTLRLTGEVTSSSYVRMTLALLDRLGAQVKATGDLAVIRVSPGGPAPASLSTRGGDASIPINQAATLTMNEPRGPRPRGLPAFDYRIEPDASGATYFWTAAAILPGARVRVEGLSDSMLQGDAAYAHMLGRMGASVQVATGEPPLPTLPALPGETGPRSPSIAVRGPERLSPVLADMRDMPDAVMSLAIACCFARGHSVIRGVRTLRVKESDRVAALKAELAKIGVEVFEHPEDADTLTITPPAEGVDCRPDVAPVRFETYRDHRMAMSLALLGLRRPNVLMNDPACVGKTYPGFWADLATLGAAGTA